MLKTDLEKDVYTTQTIFAVRNNDKTYLENSSNWPRVKKIRAFGAKLLKTDLQNILKTDLDSAISRKITAAGREPKYQLPGLM